MALDRSACSHVVMVCATLAVTTVLCAQSGPIWTVVRYPLDERFQAALVSPTSTGGGGKEDTFEPGGLVRVSRDGTHTSVDVDIRGFRSGTYTIYTVDPTGRTTTLATFKAPTYKKVHELPAAYDTFMIIVSGDGNLKSMPASAKIVLYSAVPRDLQVVRR